MNLRPLTSVPGVLGKRPDQGGACLGRQLWPLSFMLLERWLNNNLDLLIAEGDQSPVRIAKTQMGQVAYNRNMGW